MIAGERVFQNPFGHVTIDPLPSAGEMVDAVSGKIVAAVIRHGYAPVSELVHQWDMRPKRLSCEEDNPQLAQQASHIGMKGLLYCSEVFATIAQRDGLSTANAAMKAWCPKEFTLGRMVSESLRGVLFARTQATDEEEDYREWQGIGMDHVKGNTRHVSSGCFALDACL